MVLTLLSYSSSYSPVCDVKAVYQCIPCLWWPLVVQRIIIDPWSVRINNFVSARTWFVDWFMKKKKVVRMFSPLTAWSWRAEQRCSLNAPHHLSLLYGEKRLVDKTVTVCRHCGTRKSNDSGNTSSMVTYLKQHHPSASLTGVKTKAAQQPHITAEIMQPLVA